MIDDFVLYLNTVLPLRVTSVEFTNPFVQLIGGTWALSLACDWELRRDQTIEMTWDQQDLFEAAHIFIGQDLVAVRHIPGSPDPIFTLSGGAEIVVMADTDLDPWVMHTADRVFVGALTPPPGTSWP